MIVQSIRRLTTRLASNDRSQSHLERLLREYVPKQKWLYIAAVIAMVIVAGTSALTALLMETIIDAMTAYDDRYKIFLVAGAVALVFMVKGIANYVQMVALARAGNRIVAGMQERLYSKLLEHGVSFFSAKESSDLLMRLVQGAQGARTAVELVVTSIARDSLMLIGLIAVMIYQQPVLSLVSLVLGPIAVFGVKMLVERVRDIMKTEMLALSEIIKVLQETSKGIQVIKVFSLEDRMSERMGTAVRSVEKRANTIASLQAVTNPLMETLSGFAIAAIVALSAINAFGGQNPSPGQLMSFITALLMAYEPAKRISRVRVQLEAALIMVNMMFQLLDYTEELVEEPDAKDLQPGPGKIELKDVGFGYKDRGQVITSLNMECEPRKTTALVGPSGGGKSTILNLMMRLYDPHSGQVLMDGQDIRKATFASLRQRMSFVGQDTFLFSNSILENIRCSRPEASDIEVYDAAKAANAHDFIMETKNGYETQVGENGAFLSGGQKQRLALARAILKKSDFLILDEATSALDSTSENLIREALARLTENVTVVVIAHRLSTVLDADRIYVIADGQVDECGTPEELLKSNGLFRELFDQQFDGYKTALGQ